MFKPKVQRIEAFLQSESDFPSFSRYCEKKLCSENLFFWQEVQNYKHAKETVRKVIALKMVEKYVISGAENQVNLDSPIILGINEKIKNQSFPPDLFKEAEYHVLCLMECDVLPGYRKWKFIEDFKTEKLKIGGFNVIEDWKHGSSSPRDKKLTKKLQREKSKILLQT